MQEIAPSHCVSSFNFLLIGTCNPDPGAEEYQLRSGCFLGSAQLKEYLSFFFFFKFSVAIHKAHAVA